ncbi:NAD(+) diphosphatase [Chelativorans salis]|uniref:NAD(+) diphosphatase n=1 Tax=Chelativorans salis TaxID=2978478 RepID=A0ABT2LJJ3_9HYPH|nr:NAD(+) diphosphatase [Chelativorans sp. EGI FJ00035]MCT7374401.1 NAD(+) diphosphatase [Chelativorans sp. EGI FJ00035]
MNFAPPEARSEAETQIAFTGNLIDPQSEYRTDDAAGTALKDPVARLMLVREGRLCLKVRDGGFDPYFSLAEADALEGRLGEAVLLGRSARGPILAAPYDRDKEALPDDLKSIDFRSIYMQGILASEDLGALAQGAALLSWHENHRFCGRCGGETVMRAGGYRRFCSACEREHFPRTDPVAIMLAVRGDQCLLGRSPHFAPGMYSCLAGFIEPGETIENAVRRETFEESGIRVGPVTYQASQPWPFPYSLMIGCIAEAVSETVDPDLSELEDCRWFPREEVRRMLAGTHEAGLMTPPKGAIARHLIAGWVEGSREG